MTEQNLQIKLTEVLVEAGLIPGPPDSSGFSTVNTETSILDPPTTETTSSLDFLKLYDETFPELDQYHAFMESRLQHWRHSLEVKYFNSLYLNHCLTLNTVKDLRNKAMSMLEQANRLQQYHFNTLEDLDRHVSTITKPNLQKRLLKPRKVHPREFDNRQFNPTPPPTASSSRTIRCFQCNSPLHIKWHCNQYQCPHCQQIAPGHTMRNCPRNKPSHHDDGTQGYFDIEGDYDGNLNGEC